MFKLFVDAGYKGLNVGGAGFKLLRNDFSTSSFLSGDLSDVNIKTQGLIREAFMNQEPW